ncbi:hypothetical protein H0A66_09980 [Alcaligenaceae bacterium]|nr:hypothetical protein [Alcaligenaceae bacterium]
MKQLVRKPFALALILSLPLWIVFNNYIVAIIVALLVSFFLSMCHSLYLLSQGEASAKPGQQTPPLPTQNTNTPAQPDHTCQKHP